MVCFRYLTDKERLGETIEQHFGNLRSDGNRELAAVPW